MVFALHAGALWRDEINTVRFAEMPLGSIWAKLQYDTMPLGAPLLLRAAAAAGLGSDAGLRACGALCGLGLLAAMAIAGFVLSRRPPLLVLALAGLSPIVLRYGDSIRPFGIGALFLVAMLACLSRARFGWAAACAVLAVQCSYPNLVLVAAAGLAAALVGLRRSGVRGSIAPAAIVLAAGASLLPYAGPLQRSRAWAEVAQLPATPADILEVAHYAFGGGLVGVAWLWLLLPLVCLTRGLFFRTSARDHDSTLFAGTLLVAAPCAFLLLMLGMRVPTQPWYYVPLIALCAPCLEAIVAAAADRPRWRWARLGGAAVLAGLLALAAWNTAHTRQTNLDLIARELERQAGPQDLVVLDPWYCGITFRRYYRGAARDLSLPPLEDLTIHRYDLLKAQVAAERPLDPVLAAIASTLRSGNQVWLVSGWDLRDPGPALEPLPPAPHGLAGWSSLPYLHVWESQLRHYLVEHAGTGSRVAVEGEGRVSEFEHQYVIVVRGWRG
ncbi:MAG TPA: hypothetical protein VJS92_05975 [Candidatus Polarisedimenticolaceae bacterium]|nr:hypothetical protein [Candidatus Polarisedimenticolaceae bacterium]